jgi:hypothetical protein
MVKADKLAVALLVIKEEELFIAGDKSDIQRLSNAGVVAGAWDIKLDNGHRPYPAARRRVDYDITAEPSSFAKNAVTQDISNKTGIIFAYNLHPLIQTYLFRETATFWSDLFVDFSEDACLPPGKDLQHYHAVYRGSILPNISSVKFIRL